MDNLILTHSDPNHNRILLHVPDEIRDQILAYIGGQKAIRFPAAYFIKASFFKSPLWQNLSVLDSKGYVIKTAPDFLLDGFVRYLSENGIEFELIDLGDER